MKATKGPWSYAHPGIYSSDRKVCEIDGNNYHGENIANARLISCAPEMIAMLKRMIDPSESVPDLDEIKSLISKAEQQ